MNLFEEYNWVDLSNTPRAWSGVMVLEYNITWWLAVPETLTIPSNQKTVQVRSNPSKTDAISKTTFCFNGVIPVNGTALATTTNKIRFSKSILLSSCSK